MLFLLAAPKDHLSARYAAVLVNAPDEATARRAAMESSPRSCSELSAVRSPILSWHATLVSNEDGALPAGLPVCWFQGKCRSVYQPQPE